MNINMFKIINKHKTYQKVKEIPKNFFPLEYDKILSLNKINIILLKIAIKEINNNSNIFI